MSERITQKSRLLEHLRTFGRINPLQAWTQLGIYRLAAVVHLLRSDGEEIATEMVEVRNRWGETVTVAEYRLEGITPLAQRPLPKFETQEVGHEAPQQTFAF